MKEDVFNNLKINPIVVFANSNPMPISTNSKKKVFEQIKQLNEELANSLEKAAGNLYNIFASLLRVDSIKLGKAIICTVYISNDKNIPIVVESAYFNEDDKSGMKSFFDTYFRVFDCKEKDILIFEDRPLSSTEFTELILRWKPEIRPLLV